MIIEEFVDLGIVTFFANWCLGNCLSLILWCLFGMLNLSSHGLLWGLVNPWIVVSWSDWINFCELLSPNSILLIVESCVSSGNLWIKGFNLLWLTIVLGDVNKSFLWRLLSIVGGVMFGMTSLWEENSLSWSLDWVIPLNEWFIWLLFGEVGCVMFSMTSLWEENTFSWSLNWVIPSKLVCRTGSKK